ncbi:MAG TPA: NAD-dependent epimerase/dehydratase family protein [Caldimonas sp.]|jgi:nucleoside-diphosphate-sugar epimerase|nr:NAD-dependent epimerase/dehydratase family protein [Caldimonas sp.]HEV7578664.1 NAD-dependent epimerase/dehydratase family protein [Caldimonas sp.]
MNRTASARTVLVLGANGRFGLAAAQAFAGAGWRVLAHVRRDAAIGMPVGAELVRAPLASLAEALAERPTPSVVVHGINPLYTRWGAEALPAAHAAMDLAERLGARLMLPGNVYNYGAAMPARLDESTPQRPTTAKGRIRAEMESELARRAGAGRLGATVITAGDFFGAGSGSWLDQVVVKSIAAGRIDYPGDPALVHAWAYLPDVARAFVAVAALPDLAPFERFPFAGHSVTGEEFVGAVERAAAALGAAPPRGWRHGRMPWALIRVGGVVLPLWRELAKMAYLWRVPHALDGTRLAARCPALAPTPLDAAMRASLAALGVGAARPRHAAPAAG